MRLQRISPGRGERLSLAFAHPGEARRRLKMAQPMRQDNPMPNFFCVPCGAQFAEPPAPPDRCPICDDERQYVGWKGQQWITPEELKAAHHNIVREEEPGLTGIGAEPDFAISQRALLVQAPTGNVLWDCTSLIDEAAVQAVRERGG